MEVLLVMLLVVGLGLLVLSVAFLHLTWSTLTVHRQAMHALHQKLAREELERRQRAGAGGPR